jgi:hypothetical protein
LKILGHQTSSFSVWLIRRGKWKMSACLNKKEGVTQ